jgi:8-oxo-dGTP pyrophosphatase MutT (NUDIX family)
MVMYKEYALSQLRKAVEKEKTASQADYRPRGTLLMTDGKGNVFAGKTESDPKPGLEATSPYYFPGGGIMPEGSSDTPTGDQVREAVKKEALEELGRKIHKIKLLRSQGLRLDMPDWWVQRNLKKRGIKYKGLDEYYVSAREGKKDESLYGSEGDAFDGKYYPIEEVASALQSHGEESGSDFAEANKLQAELLRRLKTASARKYLAPISYRIGENMAKDVAKKLKAKKEDHATQRLKERTELDPEVINKLRASIRANQAQIPDGHHHVTLDDGSRAVIKELRRRHVLATILASNMDRYPGQDLQYLNTKTAGLNMQMVRGAGRAIMGAGRTAGRLAAPSAVGAAGGGAVGYVTGNPGNRMQNAKRMAGYGALAGAGFKGLGSAGKALGKSALGQRAIGSANKLVGHANRRTIYKPRIGTNAAKNMREMSKATSVGQRVNNAILSGARGVENMAGSPMRFVDKHADRLFRSYRNSPATAASQHYLRTGRDAITMAGRGPKGSRALQSMTQSAKPVRSQFSRFKSRVVDPITNSGTVRGMGTLGLGYAAYTADNPVSGAGYATLGALMLGSRGMGSAARAAMAAGNTAKGRGLNKVYTGIKKVYGANSKKGYAVTGAKLTGATPYIAKGIANAGALVGIGAGANAAVGSSGQNR